MTKEDKINQISRMLKNCPEILSPSKVIKWSPLGKNKVYEIIKNGDLRSFVYRGSYIIAKDDLIEYLADHSEDESSRAFKVKGGDA